MTPSRQAKFSPAFHHVGSMDRAHGPFIGGGTVEHSVASLRALFGAHISVASSARPPAIGTGTGTLCAARVVRAARLMFFSAFFIVLDLPVHAFSAFIGGEFDVIAQPFILLLFPPLAHPFSQLIMLFGREFVQFPLEFIPVPLAVEQIFSHLLDLPELGIVSAAEQCPNAGQQDENGCRDDRDFSFFHYPALSNRRVRRRKGNCGNRWFPTVRESNRNRKRARFPSSVRSVFRRFESRRVFSGRERPPATTDTRN
jgi:hypothetical protein